MYRVTITGWKVGLKKISLNDLLREHAGYSLSQARQAVDGLLAGRSFAFDVSDERSVILFCESATAIGAICEWREVT